MAGPVAAAPTLILTLFALAAHGGVATTFRAVATCLAQLESDPAIRGRVVSLLIVASTGTSPVSGPLIGGMSEQLGAQTAVGLGAGASFLATLVTWRYLVVAGTGSRKLRAKA